MNTGYDQPNYIYTKALGLLTDGRVVAAGDVSRSNALAQRILPGYPGLADKLSLMPNQDIRSMFTDNGGD